MEELIKILTPYAWRGFCALAGMGGTIAYYKKRANGKWNGQDERRQEPCVTQRECGRTHEGIQSALEAGNERMHGIETQFRELNNHLMEHFDK